MSTELAFRGESATLGQLSERLTLVAGSGFCLSSLGGEVDPGAPHGLFFADTRFLSCLQLRIDGRPVETLATIPAGLHEATVIGRVHLDADPTCSVLVFRRRRIDSVLRETVVVRNSGGDPLPGELELRIGSDFAGVFEVKEDRVPESRIGGVSGTGHEVVLTAADGHHRSRVRLDRPFSFDAGAARVALHLPPKGEWALEISVTANVDEDNAAEHEPSEEDDGLTTGRADQWRSRSPALATDDHRLVGAFDRSVDDLGALRIFDRRYGGVPVLAAGAPWFMTLFGRDSLLASWMALLIDPALAVQTLQVLADLQGAHADPRTEEEPGRILHEVRVRHSSLVAPGGGDIYYGTADATPLFVALVGEVARWGVAPEVLAPLLPHVDRALEWIDRWGDRDGDGYVEYQPSHTGALDNQGWKDSWDAISFADGRLADAPIALCEVQGYVHAAFVARAELAELFGEPAAAADAWRTRARDLRRRFNQDFWVEEHGWYALALDRDKRPVDALGSNVGHALWSGILDEQRAAEVGARLVSDELFTGWGIRTLATNMERYHPLSYHNGSVWPHDTALAGAGLMRYGLVEAAHRLIDGLLEATRHYSRHLPELFSGLDRVEAPVPVDYPTSSAPQAWAAAAPLLALRTLLRLDPDVPHGRLHLAPALLPGMDHLRLDNLPLGNGMRLSVDVRGGDVSVSGLPDEVVVVSAPRAVDTRPGGDR